MDFRRRRRLFARAAGGRWCGKDAPCPSNTALGIMVVATALLRLLCACYLGLGNDEAYHSLYADHPSLGYYDHPPMMAWIEMAGLTLAGAGASTWPLRVGFIALFAGSTCSWRADGPILRRARGVHCGAGDELDWILWSGRFDVCPARWPAAVFLAS